MQGVDTHQGTLEEVGMPELDLGVGIPEVGRQLNLRRDLGENWEREA